MKGEIKAICISKKRGTEKTQVPSAEFIKDHGIKNDAHAGNWHRQISLLSFEKIEQFRRKGADVAFGAFGENLVVEGFDFIAQTFTSVTAMVIFSFLPLMTYLLFLGVQFFLDFAIKVVQNRR